MLVIPTLGIKENSFLQVETKPVDFKAKKKI
jgi:hypothetical protein